MKNSRGAPALLKGRLFEVFRFRWESQRGSRTESRDREGGGGRTTNGSKPRREAQRKLNLL